jgi:hypothetical protein
MNVAKSVEQNDRVNAKGMAAKNRERNARCFGRHSHSAGCGSITAPDVSANRDAPQLFAHTQRKTAKSVALLIAAYACRAHSAWTDK